MDLNHARLPFRHTRVSRGMMITPLVTPRKAPIGKATLGSG